MKRKKRNKDRDFFDLTPEEQERELARFDKPIDLERDTRPLTARERALFKRAMANEPRVSIHVGNGGIDVVIHLDDALLSQAEDYAKRKRTSLPKMIDRGLRGLLAFDA